MNSKRCSISLKCSPLFIMKNLSTAMVKNNSITSRYSLFKAMTSPFYDESKAPVHPNDVTMLFLDDDQIIFDDVNP